MREFEVEISRTDELGIFTSATLELPATWAEYHDAMDKARIITTFRPASYSVEICSTDRRCLDGRIGEPVHLLELNLLAQRLAGLSVQESGIFNAMVAIEQKQHPYATIPLSRLINFTHSVDNCRVAYGIHDEVSLGRWLYENDMLPEDVRDFATARIFWGDETEEQRFGLIGARHKQRESGAFCDAGYVEMETVSEVYTYVPGETDFFNRKDGTVVLEVGMGYFNDPGYHNNDVSTTLYLPATEDAIDNAIEAVGASSNREIGWHCTECLIPAARELISFGEDVHEVNRFAKALADMQRHTLPNLYKAMFEMIKPIDLDAATALVSEVHDYTLTTGSNGPEDYAKEYLSRLRGGNDSIDLSEMINLYALGEKVMKLENAEWTSYGILKRKDGGPIWTMDSTVAPTAGMEMGGL